MWQVSRFANHSILETVIATIQGETSFDPVLYTLGEAPNVPLDKRRAKSLNIKIQKVEKGKKSLQP